LSHPRTLPAPALAAVNHLLAQASWARQKLQPFAGQCAHLNLPPFSALFSITADGFIAAPPAEATAAVTLDLPASAPLLALQGKAAVMRAAQITGSAEFAQELGYVMQHLRWDIEEDLSRVVGDIAAHRLTTGASAFAAWQRDKLKSLAENLAEYLTEERPAIARRLAIADFSADVDCLRDDVARLEKRLQRL
jgi:ubiquinone biosynthesis protein UbiJ